MRPAHSQSMRVVVFNNFEEREFSSKPCRKFTTEETIKESRRKKIDAIRDNQVLRKKLLDVWEM